MKWLALIIPVFFCLHTKPQCLSSVNPVGGTSNLLILNTKTIRVISFYKLNYGNQYFEENKPSDFNLIKSASYNYLGTILVYGLTPRLTIETETGYFINKTQVYNVMPEQKKRGYGFSNMVVSAKYGIYSNNQKRLFFSASAGVKMPFSRNYQVSEGVELPEEVQPTLGSFGMVFQSFLIKENSFRGTRYFMTNRLETNCANNKKFRLGTSVYTSLFISKHLMFQWLKGDWTSILQLRNEIRKKNYRENNIIEASGGILFFLSPQINYSIKETWNISVMGDIPVYQYLNSIQLGTKLGFTIGLSRDFSH